MSTAPTNTYNIKVPTLYGVFYIDDERKEGLILSNDTSHDGVTIWLTPDLQAAKDKCDYMRKQFPYSFYQPVVILAVPMEK